MTITETERIGEETYRRIALGDDDHLWDLHQGRLREKPGMSAEHNDAVMPLVAALLPQLDRSEFRVRANPGRLRRPDASYPIPDLFVVPTAIERATRGRPGTLETYDVPLPLVVEVWSPSTGGYDATLSRGGEVRPAFLPNVAIDLDALFDQ